MHKALAPGCRWNTYNPGTEQHPKRTRDPIRVLQEEVLASLEHRERKKSRKGLAPWKLVKGKK